MSDEHKQYASTAAATLEAHILSVHSAKNDAEWWANREILRLREELEKTKRFYIEAGFELRQLREDNKRLEAEKAVWQGVQQGTADVVKQLEAEVATLRAENETHKEIAVRETMNVATLRAALRPFADAAERNLGPDDARIVGDCTLGDLRAAAAALKDTQLEKGAANGEGD